MADKRKTTTKQQFERLVALIESNTDVVKDLSKGSAKFWELVSKELNPLGPPTKDGSGWKKVWSDYRSSLKKKLSFNHQEYRATGGGPCNLHTFSALGMSSKSITMCTTGTQGPVMGVSSSLTSSSLPPSSLPPSSSSSTITSTTITTENEQRPVLSSGSFLPPLIEDMLSGEKISRFLPKSREKENSAAIEIDRDSKV